MSTTGQQNRDIGPFDFDRGRKLQARHLRHGSICDHKIHVRAVSDELEGLGARGCFKNRMTSDIPPSAAPPKRVGKIMSVESHDRQTIKVSTRFAGIQVP